MNMASPSRSEISRWLNFQLSLTLPGSEILLETLHPHQHSYFVNVEQQKSKGTYSVSGQTGIKLGEGRTKTRTRTIALPPTGAPPTWINHRGKPRASALFATVVSWEILELTFVFKQRKDSHWQRAIILVTVTATRQKAQDFIQKSI